MHHYNFHGHFIDGYYGKGGSSYPDEMEMELRLQIKHDNDHVRPMLNSNGEYAYMNLVFGSTEAFNEFADYVARLRKVMEIE